MQFDQLSNRVVGCAIEVHRHLGPGLLESAYERCLAYELVREQIPFAAQVLTYMKLADIHTGLLINFNVKILKDGIRRFVL